MKKWFVIIFLISLKCWPCSQTAPPWNKSEFIVNYYRMVKNSQWIAYGTITYSSVFHDRGADCSPTSLEVKVKLDDFVKGSLAIKEIRTQSYRQSFYRSGKPIPLGTKMIVIGGESGVKAFELADDSDTRYLLGLVAAFKDPNSKTSIFEVVRAVKDENTIAMIECYKKKKNKIAECADKVKYPQIAYPYIFWSEVNAKGLSSKYCDVLGIRGEFDETGFNCLKSAKQRENCNYAEPATAIRSNDPCSLID